MPCDSNLAPVVGELVDLRVLGPPALEDAMAGAKGWAYTKNVTFWKGFWGRVLRRVLRRGSAMGFTVQRVPRRVLRRGLRRGFPEGA